MKLKLLFMDTGKQDSKAVTQAIGTEEYNPKTLTYLIQYSQTHKVNPLPTFPG